MSYGDIIYLHFRIILLWIQSLICRTDVIIDCENASHKIREGWGGGGAGDRGR